jgi:hypothetical protein
LEIGAFKGELNIFCFDFGKIYYLFVKKNSIEPRKPNNSHFLFKKNLEILYFIMKLQFFMGIKIIQLMLKKLVVNQ